jgi:hypothetical protein
MENRVDNREGQRGLMLDDRACAFELETTFDDNVGSYGNMFDIKTLGGEISIYAMDIYVDLTKPVNYEIYTKPNSFKDDNGKLSLKAWTLVKKGAVVGTGRHSGTLIRDFSLGNLTMAPNEVRAFYVTLDSSDLRYRDIAQEMPAAVVGDLYIDNEDIAVYVGVSLNGFPLLPSTQFFGKRVWSGRFYYEAQRACIPSASPSMVELPSISPSSYPSTLTPTFQPTLEPSESPSATAPTLLPTLEISAAPSRIEPDEWMCPNNKVLQTAIDGGTGAYGNMFTVTAKREPVKITTLSLHTDYEGGNITAIVYTRLGDFIGYENEPRAWRKISQSTFRGAGHGFFSKIPPEDFEPLYLFANDTVSIYITLTTADMRYSRTNGTLGSSIASNDYIDVSAGVGVADYPFASEFFLYAPRVFNGAIHFNTDADCLPMMNISYSFNVEHPDDITGTDLNRLIENNVEMTARSLISTEPVLAAHARDHQVSIDSARVLQVQGELMAIHGRIALILRSILAHCCSRFM